MTGNLTKTLAKGAAMLLILLIFSRIAIGVQTIAGEGGNSRRASSMPGGH
ncbi:MAG: hypothetical protein LAT62_03300 [Natronospirillum sp.]|nr:hypothetical protein [Natronospirillum sp.]MCH8550936.1 hypothetical protein [Natronospirillum sp.]